MCVGVGGGLDNTAGSVTEEVVFDCSSERTQGQIKKSIRSPSSCVVCAEKMRSRHGMCESGGGGGGWKGLMRKRGRISCSHSHWVNHRK